MAKHCWDILVIWDLFWYVTTVIYSVVSTDVYNGHDEEHVDASEAQRYKQVEIKHDSNMNSFFLYVLQSLLCMFFMYILIVCLFVACGQYNTEA